MVTWSSSWRAVSAAFLMSAAACSSGGDGGTDPTPEAPVTVSITLGTASVEVTQGDNAATVQISIDRPAGFTGTVNLAASAPAGITATLAPAALTGSATTSTLSIAASANVAAGDYGVTVTATGTNVATRSLVVPLSVKTSTTPPPPPPPAGSFTIAASPTAVSVQAGNQGTSAITITRVNSFAGAVALTATGAPAGVTPSFAPASVVATSSTLTLTTTGAAVPGVYPITVRANSSGQTEQTAVVTLTVTAAPGGGGSGNVSWTFCGSLAPLWFAAQDGNGAWTRITATTPGVYQFNITQARGGVAYVQQVGTRFEQRMFFLTQAELIETGASLCPNGTAKANNGSVTNVAGASVVFVTIGGRQVEVVPSTSTNFAATNVPEGPRDVVASRTAINLGTFAIEADRLLIRRNVNVASGGTIPALDLNGGESFTPVARTITLSNTLGHFTSYTTQFTTATNGLADGGFIETTTPTSALTTINWRGVPSDRQVAGDLHRVVVSAVSSLTSPANLNGRSLIYMTAAPQNANLTFGPLLTGATESALATAPYVRRRLQYTPQAEYNRYYEVAWQYNDEGGRGMHVNMSAGYAGGPVDIQVPDFSGVAGFLTTWGLKPGIQATWTFSAIGWTGGGLKGPNVDGGVAQSAQAGAQITP